MATAKNTVLLAICGLALTGCASFADGYHPNMEMIQAGAALAQIGAPQTVIVAQPMQLAPLPVLHPWNGVTSPAYQFPQAQKPVNCTSVAFGNVQTTTCQ